MLPASNVHALVRHTHEQRVLAVLRERGGLSRAEIAERIGLSRTTLSEITGDLLARGAIIVVDTDATRRSGSGRRAELLSLDPASGQYLGIDLGHSRVLALVADAAHEVIAVGSEAYPPSRPWAEQVEAAFDLVDSLAAQHGLHFGALQGVAVGVTGTDVAARHGVHVAFARRFGTEVVTDNNTRFAALAEATAESGGRVADDLVYLRLSQGVGGGLVVGGRLVPGGRGAAGELGHVRVRHGADAVRCRCGRTGCLETLASMPALLERSGLGSPQQLREAVRAGDERARAAVDSAAEAVGGVLATAALILSPDRIVVGGTVAHELPDLVTRAAAIVSAELAAVGSGPPTVRSAVLGDDDGALGAVAALVQRSPLLTDYLDPLDPPTEAHLDDARRARA